MHSMWSWLSEPRHGWQLAIFLFGASGLGFGALAILVSVPARYRKFVVIAVTFIGGLYFSLEFLIPGTKAHPNPLTGWKPFMGDATLIVYSFAMLLGIWNLFQIHGKAIAKRVPGWFNSAAFFVSFFAIIIAGFLKDWREGQVAAGYKAAQGAAAVNGGLFDIIFTGFLASLEATMFSLVAFYIVSAAYRAFRVRSVEAVLMMVTAAIIMLGLVPIGAAITSWLPSTGVLSAFRIERIAYWLLIWPNMAAQRAIGFGIAVGALAMGLRIWLSLERGGYFDTQL